MYLITNRALKKSTTLNAFGKTPSPKGPNELRLLKVSKVNNRWRVDTVDDQLSKASVKSLKDRYCLDIDINTPWHGSLKVACELFEQARSECKSILFFVHGYNNDVGDIIAAAQLIEQTHNVIVVPFTWPANGGGAISGTASYLSDKSDARASAGALNRLIEKIQQFHRMLTEAQKLSCQQAAVKKHPNNPTAATALFTQLMSKQCNVNINLLCHSMGNYVFKHTFATSQNATSKLVFDNICLVAADTNNEDHHLWVSQLDVRKRVYIVINENDSALRASRIKPGEQQKVRLGHYTRNLNSPNAHYIDLTDVDHVGSEHSYFKGEAVQKNERLRVLFSGMFGGEAIEQSLNYHADNNTYRF